MALLDEQRPRRCQSRRHVQTVDVSWTAGRQAARRLRDIEIRAFDATSGVSRSVGGVCAGIVSGTSCADTAVPNGTWKYSVAARQQLWTGAQSARSAAVSVDWSRTGPWLPPTGRRATGVCGESSGTPRSTRWPTATARTPAATRSAVSAPSSTTTNTAVDFDGSSGQVNVPSVAALRADQPGLDRGMGQSRLHRRHPVDHQQERALLHVHRSTARSCFGIFDGTTFLYVGGTRPDRSASGSTTSEPTTARPCACTGTGCWWPSRR